jgi:hypothetical protein
MEPGFVHGSSINLEECVQSLVPIRCICTPQQGYMYCSLFQPTTYLAGGLEVPYSIVW